jgi:hypothetical protein
MTVNTLIEMVREAHDECHEVIDYVMDPRAGAWPLPWSQAKKVSFSRGRGMQEALHVKDACGLKGRGACCTPGEPLDACGPPTSAPPPPLMHVVHPPPPHLPP